MPKKLISCPENCLTFSKVRSLMLPSKPQEKVTERTCTSCPTKRTISCQSQRYKHSGYSPQVHNVEKVPDFRAEYPRLFKGLRLIGQEYRIPLKQDTVSVCLYPSTRTSQRLKTAKYFQNLTQTRGFGKYHWQKSLVY